MDSTSIQFGNTATDGTVAGWLASSASPLNIIDDGVTLLIYSEPVQVVVNHPGPSAGPPDALFFSSGYYTGGVGEVPSTWCTPNAAGTQRA